MTALIEEYKNYKEGKADPGNLEILQHSVWEMEAKLTPLPEIYGLGDTKNSRTIDDEDKLEQIARMLSDAKKNFSKIKDRHKR